MNDFRLIKAILDKRYYPYVNGLEDIQYPYIKWYVYGLIDTQEILVVIMNENNNNVFYKVEQSPVIWPHMRNRVWGIDVDDDKLAKKMSLELWEENKEKLFVSPVIR